MQYRTCTFRHLKDLEVVPPTKDEQREFAHSLVETLKNHIKSQSTREKQKNIVFLVIYGDIFTDIFSKIAINETINMVLL